MVRRYAPLLPTGANETVLSIFVQGDTAEAIFFIREGKVSSRPRCLAVVLRNAFSVSVHCAEGFLSQADRRPATVLHKEAAGFSRGATKGSGPFYSSNAKGMGIG